MIININSEFLINPDNIIFIEKEITYDENFRITISMKDGWAIEIYFDKKFSESNTEFKQLYDDLACLRTYIHTHGKVSSYRRSL